LALINILIALALLGGEAMDGYAPRYSPGVMERVVRRRDLAPAACNISSAYYPLGTWVYVWSHNRHILRYCRVADVSHPRDVARHQRTKRVIELGYTEAQSLCGDAAMQAPPTACPVTVVHLQVSKE